MSQVILIIRSLSKKIEIELYFLFFLILIAAVLEVLGLSLIIPLIDAVLNKDNGEFLALDTLKNIIKQNNWPCKNVLELYLKCKKFYG